MIRDRLDPSAIADYVGLRHCEFEAYNATPGLADPQAVGRLALEIASALYSGLPQPAADRDQVDEPAQQTIAQCAGYLVYAMDGYGLDYEDVCRVADHAVAQVLIRITPDNRLPSPRRNLEQRSALGQGTEVHQLVKLAEIICAARGILGTLSPKEFAANAGYLKNWCDSQAHLLGAMQSLARRPRGATFVEQARKLLAAIVTRAEAARHPGSQLDGRTATHSQGRRADRVPLQDDRSNVRHRRTACLGRTEVAGRTAL